MSLTNIASFSLAPIDSWASDINYAQCSKTVAALSRTSSIWHNLLREAMGTLRVQHLWQMQVASLIRWYLTYPEAHWKQSDPSPWIACIMPLSCTCRSWWFLYKKTLRKLHDVRTPGIAGDRARIELFGISGHSLPDLLRDLAISGFPFPGYRSV